MIGAHPLGPAVQAYFYRYLTDVKGVSPHTILAYRDALKLLLRFAGDRLRVSPDRLCIEDITEGLVIDFLGHLEKDRGNCPRTRNARYAGIRSFFGFVGRENPELLEQCRKIGLIPVKRTDHRPMQYLDHVEVRGLLEAVDTSSKGGVRDRALLLTLYNTGARVKEIVDLTIDDLRLEPPSQVRLLGKGRKQRACPLWPETVRSLERHIATRQPKDLSDQRLFLNANGQPITRFGVRHIIRRYVNAASSQCPSLRDKRVGPHTFRHTTAMHLIQAGNDINMVRLWLGHANINTTHAYVELDMEMKRRILATTSPPGSHRKGKRLDTWQEPHVLAWLDDLSKRVAVS